MAENALRKAGCSVTADGEVYTSSLQVGNLKNGVFTTLPVYSSEIGVEKSSETIIAESIMKEELDRWTKEKGLTLVQKDETMRSGAYNIFSLGTDKHKFMGAAVESYRKFRDRKGYDLQGYDLAGEIEKKVEKKVREALRLARANLPKLSRKK